MAGSSVVETSKVGKRGTVVIPARLRKRFKIVEGALLIAEERPEGVLLRPAIAVPIENYTPERVAEFLLTNAVDQREYAAARRRVKKMGINPDAVAHVRPE